MRLPLLLLTVLLTFVAGCGASSGTPAPASSRPTSSTSTSPSTSPSGSAARVGGSWSVVGVARGDRLNVRRTPGVAGVVVDRLAPTASGIATTGARRTVGAATWIEISIGETRGWVNAAYLGRLAAAEDVTSRLRSTPISSTRLGLARRVATKWGYGATPVVVQVTSTAILVDVLGLEDDSIRGGRLRVVPRMGEAGFEVRSVSAAPVCVRGVSAGRCS